MQQPEATIDLGTELIGASLAAGADHAEVFMRSTRTTDVTFRDDHTSESIGHQEGLALRVWCGERQALLTANDLLSIDLPELAREAVLLARRHGVPVPAVLHDRTQSYLGQGAARESIPLAEKVAQIEQIMTTMRSATATPIIVKACYSESAMQTTLVNSHELKAAYDIQSHMLWFWVEGPAGHLKAAASGSSWGGLDPPGLSRYLAERTALLQQPATAAPSGPCTVLLSPEAAADLARSLGNVLAAEHVLDGMRRLLDRIDQPIASPAVTLVDDGCLPGGIKSRPIDDEGTPAHTTTLIERGTLRALLHTLGTAAQLGVAPNGKAWRSMIWDTPRATPSNIFLQPGGSEPAALRQEIDRGLVVEHVLRPGRIQPATGKFNILVQGWWIEHGELIRQVSSVPLSANLFELLRSIRRCGNDLGFSPLANSAGAPSILVEPMNVG
jgi:PmbA protein